MAARIVLQLWVDGAEDPTLTLEIPGLLAGKAIALVDSALMILRDEAVLRERERRSTDGGKEGVKTIPVPKQP